MKKYASFVGLILVCMFCMGANNSCDTNTDSMYRKEQNHTVDNQSRLYQNQPPVSLTWSLERENINKRTLRWNDPNKVSYIYLINYGKIMAFYTIKGKVSSVNSQVTNTMQIVSYSTGPAVIPSPAEDGSYGENGDGIFFFTTEGAYVEWKGDYMLCDMPLKLTQPPEMVVERKQ